MLIIENNGQVLAATNAAAKFCNPDFTLGRELKGKFIEDTQYAELKEREAAELARCRETDEPANAVEWLLTGDGSIRPYVVSRICFPKGRWMIVLQPIALTEPWLQKPPKEMIKAPNFQPQITEEQLEVLIDYEAGLNPEQSAKRIGCSALDESVFVLRG